jgi:hypothetical protein
LYIFVRSPDDISKLFHELVLLDMALPYRQNVGCLSFLPRRAFDICGGCHVSVRQTQDGLIGSECRQKKYLHPSFHEE